MEVFTIVHTNLTAAVFVTALRRYEIDVVVDVRSAPYSRYCVPGWRGAGTSIPTAATCK